MKLYEIFNSDELSRRVFKHNQNIYALSALTQSFQEFLPLSGGTVSGTTYFLSGLSVNELSGGTLYSGTTNLYDIFAPIGSGGGGSGLTQVQNGINTFTGGTIEYPTVNITSATLNNLNISGINVSNQFSATTISGGTFYSGSTNLYDIFSPIGSGGIHTQVQNGINTFTGGSINLPTINITSATLNNLNVSGTNISNQFSATTISGGTFYSGTTNLENIITNLLSGISITLTGSTATTLNTWTVSGSNYYSDFNHFLGTNDYTISIYNTLNNEDIIVDKIHRINEYTVRIFVSDNTLSVRVILVAKGGNGDGVEWDILNGGNF